MSAAEVTPILYVEDENVIRELVAMVLEDAGFEVVAAADGASACEALDRKDEKPFRAIITDISLGVGPDGWAVARHARELNNTLPVIYVTGAHGLDWRSNAVPNSVMIVKPFTPTQLVFAISSLLNRPGTTQTNN